MLISADNHEFPSWAPDWLRAQVESPDCSQGTHPRLRWLAKWLVIYFAEHEGGTQRWLRYAAEQCDRDVPSGEIDRLLIWAESLFGQGHRASDETSAPLSHRSRPDLEEIYVIASAGLNLAEYRASSPQRLYDSPR